MNPLPDHWLWHDAKLEPGPAVIFDIDGVLADASARQHHLEKSPPDWRSFFDAAGEDALIEEAAQILAEVPKDIIVILLTGRPMRIRPATKAWFEKFDLRWDLLIMRESGSYEKAFLFKQRTIKELRREGFDLQMAYEDDEQICKMYEQEGLPATYMHSGYYEHRLKRYPTDASSAGEPASN